MKTNVESVGTQRPGRKDARRKMQKVRKQHHQIQRREEDSAEIKAYLNKLQDIVPFMPKNKRLSKLEVISHVIEYIRNLRQTLGLSPLCVNDVDSDFDMESETSMIAALAAAAKPTAVATLTVINQSGASSMEPTSYCQPPPHPQTRQPLVSITNPTLGGSS